MVEISRIEQLLHRHGDRFIERVFTQHERLYCESAPKKRAERYAARFAAKEAALKALGTGWRDGIAWTDIEVTLAPSGRPGLLVTGYAGAFAFPLGIQHWFVSLSHTADLAIASVLACRSSL